MSYALAVAGVVKYESSDKITETIASRHHLAALNLYMRRFRVMCFCLRLTVRLHNDGRHFTCAYCLRVRQHPPVDIYYYVKGYAYCDYCGELMKIETSLRETPQKARATALKGS